jgi:hypothetical protein
VTFIISHIFREENQCADGLANICVYIPDFQWWALYLIIYVMLFLETNFVFLNIDFVKFWDNALFFLSLSFFLWILRVKFLMREL